MEEEMIRSLNECISLVKRLKNLLSADESFISSCIRGDIMVEYEKNSKKALEVMNELESSAYVLQSELLEMQMLGI